MIRAKDEYIEKQSDVCPNEDVFVEKINNSQSFKYGVYAAWLCHGALKEECNDIAKEYNTSRRTYFANKISDSIYIIEYTDYDDVKRYIPYVVGKKKISSPGNCTAYSDYDDALTAALCIKYMDEKSNLGLYNMVDVINKLIDKDKEQNGWLRLGCFL